MSNNSVQPAIAIFDKDRTELLGIAPEGTSDITYLPTISKEQADAGATAGVVLTTGGKMISRGGVDLGAPVGCVVDPITGGVKIEGLAVQSCASVILWGDSMERQVYAQVTYTDIAYDSATGIVTVTASNSLWVGYRIDFTIQGLPAWNHRNVPILTQDSASFTFQITAGLGTLPTAEKIVGRRHFISASHPYAWLRSSRPELLLVAGVNGETTANILARTNEITTAVGNRSGVVVFCSGGVNDTGTSAEALANIEGMVRHVISLGCIPVVRTVPPRDSMTALQMSLMSELNRSIRKLPQKYPGCYVSDRYAAIVDPTTGLAKTGYLQDGVHPSSIGGRAIAKYDQAVLDSIFGVLPSALPMGQSDGYHATNNPGSKNVFDNCCLGTATGGTVTAPVTGTAAAGLTVARTGSATTVVASVVAGSIGNAQRVVFTPAAAADALNITMANQIARAPAGSTVRMLGRLKVSSAANIRSASLLGYVVDGSTKISVYDKQSATTAANTWPQEDGEFDFETDWFVLPAAATQVYSRFQVVFAAAGPAVTIEASNWDLEIK